MYFDLNICCLQLCVESYVVNEIGVIKSFKHFPSTENKDQ